MKPGVYHALDSVLNVVLLWPAMVLYWRGIWDLWGHYTDENPWVMFGVGWLSFLGYFIQPVLSHYLLPLREKQRVAYEILVRVYLLCISSVLMCFWRGVWDVADQLGGFGYRNNVICYLVCYGIVLVSRSGRSCIFPPMFTVDDTAEGVLKPATRFSVKPSLSIKYVLDCVYSHVILFLSIVSWRSMLNIVFISLFDDPFKTQVACLIIGLCLMTLLFALEEPLAWGVLWAERKGGWWAKLIYEDALYLFILWSQCFLWIGGWDLVAAYCFPAIPEGAWTCMVIGLVLLMSLQQFKFVSCCGCAVDGDDQGRDAIFPTKFLRHFVMPKKIEDFTLSEEQQVHGDVVVTSVENLGTTVSQHVYDNPAMTNDLGMTNISMNGHSNNGTVMLDNNNNTDCSHLTPLPQ